MSAATQAQDLTPQQALEVLCEEAGRQGAQAFDALAGYSRSTGLTAFGGKVQNTEISESVGAGIRLFLDGRPGYASTERLTREVLARTVKDAIDHARLTDPLTIELPGPATLPEGHSKVAPELEKLGLEAMKDMVLELEGKALQGHSEVVNVPYLGAGRNYSQSWFANHQGVRHSEAESDFSIGVGVVAARDGVSKMGVYSRAGRSVAIADTSLLAVTAVERAVELLGAAPVDGGDYPVVFSNRVSNQIFSIFASMFYGDVVQKGQSRLAGCEGQSIATPLLHLCSDPTRIDMPGYGQLDGEGVVQRRIPVIERGVLQGFLHNLESAHRGNTKPTGNASRSYAGRVGTSFGNLIVELGNSTLVDMLSAHSRCLYIVKLEGASGCSSVSGQISIGAQGFLVENGKVVRPVDGITLSSNILDLWKGIEAIGDTYNDNFSSIKVPDLLVSRMGVSS